MLVDVTYIPPLMQRSRIVAKDFSTIYGDQFFKRPDFVVDPSNVSSEFPVPHRKIPSSYLKPENLWSHATKSDVKGFLADIKAVMTHEHFAAIAAQYRVSREKGQPLSKSETKWQFYELWGDSVLYTFWILLVYELVPKTIAGAKFYEVCSAVEARLAHA